MCSFVCTALSLYHTLLFTFTHVSYRICDNLRVQWLCWRHGHTLQLAFIRTDIAIAASIKCFSISPRLHISATSTRCTRPQHNDTNIRIDRYFYFMNKCETTRIKKPYRSDTVILSRFPFVRHMHNDETRLITYPSFYCRQCFIVILLWA